MWKLAGVESPRRRLLLSSALLEIETVLKKERRRAGKLQSVHYIGEVEWTDVDGAIKKRAMSGAQEPIGRLT